MNIALFVDFENVRLAVQERVADRRLGAEATLGVLSELVQRLEQGDSRVLLRRAYADWERSEITGLLQSLALLGIRPEYVLSRRGKNSSDLELSIAVMEALLTRLDITTFVLVAGDRDFIPIASRIRESGKRVMIVGFRESTANDLIEVVGQANFLEGDSLLRAWLDRAGPRPLVLLRNGPGDRRRVALEERISSGVAAPQQHHAECVRLLLEAESRHGTEIWLVPFYKEYMNVRFDSMNNAQRKMIVNDLVEWNAVEIQQRSSGLGASDQYSVLLVNHDHDLVRQVQWALEGGEPTGQVASPGAFAVASESLAPAPPDTAPAGAEPVTV